MVLRKPYAFLIKQFRIIHLILTFLSVYIINRTSDIYSFFNNYISNSYSAIITDNFASNFITFKLFLAIIIVIGILITMSILLSYKKKSDKFYFISILYYFGLIIFFLIYYSVFNTLENSVITANSARIYNDISLLVYLPQYIFVIYFAVRSLGFNVKQFNFKSDLKEMELTSSDNEEIEVNVEFDSYKAKRNARRFYREMTYYVRENLLYITIICSILLFCITYNVISNFSFFNNTYYSMGDTFYHDGFYVSFDNAYISNTDEGGNVISENKYFLIVSLYLENPSTQDKTIDINDFKLLYNKELVTPSNEYTNLFSDYGSTLIFSNIKYSSSGSYVLIYEIDQSDINDDFMIQIYTSSYFSNGISYPLYSVVNINHTVLKNTVDSNNYSLNDTINFTNTNIGNSSIKISSYEIGSLFYYDNQNCVNSVCSYYKDTLYINYSDPTHLNKTLLSLETDLILDENTEYYKNNKSYYSFFNNFVKINYVINDILYDDLVTSLSKETYDGKYYLLVPSEINNADSITLNITIRNKEYNYILK